MTVDAPERRRRPPWFGAAATLVGAVLIGGLLGVAYTAAMGGLGRSPSVLGPPPASVALASEAPNPFAEVTPAGVPDPASATPSVSPSPSPSPTASAEPTHVTTVAERCFFTGLGRPAESPPADVVAAEGLAARLPDIGSYPPEGYVGSSLTSSVGGAYVNGFEECLGVDPATIRLGMTRGGALGVILFGGQVDGYTGPELADVIVDGTYPPNDPATLRTAEHDGWTYRTNDVGFAVTASDDTVYWMQEFCCVDPDPGAGLPTFDEIVRDYLEAIVDEPA